MTPRAPVRCERCGWACTCRGCACKALGGRWNGTPPELLILTKGQARPVCLQLIKLLDDYPRNSVLDLAN